MGRKNIFKGLKIRVLMVFSCIHHAFFLLKYPGARPRQVDYSQALVQVLILQFPDSVSEKTNKTKTKNNNNKTKQTTTTMTGETQHVTGDKVGLTVVQYIRHYNTHNEVHTCSNYRYTKWKA